MALDIDIELRNTFIPNPKQAFELGILHERLTSCEQPLKSRECTVDSILRDAEKVVGKVMADTATHDQLIHVLEDIKEYERGSGLASRVRGLFNFVNFVWFLSILGKHCLKIA